MANLIIKDTKVRINAETAYVCITDIANLKRGGKENIKSWMRLFGSVEFFIAWESKHNPNFKEGDFAPFRNEVHIPELLPLLFRPTDHQTTETYLARGRPH